MSKHIRVHWKGLRKRLANANARRVRAGLTAVATLTEYRKQHPKLRDAEWTQRQSVHRVERVGLDDPRPGL